MKYISLLILIACAQIKPINKEVEKVEPQKAPLPVVDMVNTIDIFPGKVTFKSFTLRVPDGIYKLNCGKNRIYKTYVKNQTAGIYLAASYFSKTDKYVCNFDFNGKKYLVAEISVKPFKYPSEKLNVPKRKVDLSPKDIKRVIAEQKIKAEIYKHSADYYLFDSPFEKPLNSYITSHYGTRRLFNNKKQSQHLGNDLRAGVGVEIPAANRGKVVYVGNLFFSGNVVVIDHGLDIFSMYGHLSAIKVTKGSIVNKGDIVGLAGMTGRVSGPHLHWGTKINGHWVDGFSLVDESQKQFKK